jgi:glucosylceramidase
MLAALAVTATLLASAPVSAAQPPVTGTVDFGHRLQSIDGFGFSQAFQRASLIHGAQGLTAEHQREVLDLLLDRGTGAGLSILRLGIGSSTDTVYDHMPTIEPTDPGGPDAAPAYVWDGDDGGQVWLTQQAEAYGVKRFYADAWSAPGFMKDNGTDINGGTLLPEWRPAYAAYLRQYAAFYAQEGVRITDLGFTNEPDLATSYASMRFTPDQAVAMVKALGPALRGTGIKIACCDAAGWDQQAAYSAAIESDPLADHYVATHTGHPYVSDSTYPLPTDNPVWMSEWSPNGSTWNEAWDDGSAYDGISVAQQIDRTLTDAGASAYVYWFGASLGATRGLIQLDGADYHVSKRLWALAAYSRFIRPGAVRVAASAADPAVRVSAYRDRDGRRVIELLNTGTAPVASTYAVGSGGHGSVYLTDGTHSVDRVGSATVRAGRLAVRLPARSLTTVVLR